MRFMLTNFNNDALLSTFGFGANVTEKEFCDFLTNDKHKGLVDRLLHSRGYWLPRELEDKDTPEYLSIMDVLAMYRKELKS